MLKRTVSRIRVFMMLANERPDVPPVTGEFEPLPAVWDSRAYEAVKRYDSYPDLRTTTFGDSVLDGFCVVESLVMAGWYITSGLLSVLIRSMIRRACSIAGFIEADEEAEQGQASPRWDSCKWIREWGQQYLACKQYHLCSGSGSKMKAWAEELSFSSICLLDALFCQSIRMQLKTILSQWCSIRSANSIFTPSTVKQNVWHFCLLFKCVNCCDQQRQS